MFHRKRETYFLLILTALVIVNLLVASSIIGRSETNNSAATHSSSHRSPQEAWSEISATKIRRSGTTTTSRNSLEEESSVGNQSIDHEQDKGQIIKSRVVLACIHEKKTCRYDDVGDFLESSEHPGIVHKPFPSVPPHRRIPHDKANDWSYILEQRAKLPEDGSMTALMDYNAMLLPLYKNSNITTTTVSNDGDFSVSSDLDPILLDRLTGKYHPFFSDAEVKRVKYLSISRTSNLHSCKPKFKFRFGTVPQDFLGLSLLDENLARIEGTDIAINADKWLLGNRSATFFDFQIVAVRSTKENPLKDQLFLFATGHLGTFSLPIDIRRTPPAALASRYDAISWDSKVKGEAVPFSHEYQYGDGFQVKFMDNPGRFINSRGEMREDRLFTDRGVDRGKNFHIFESSSGETFMEVWPHGYDARRIDGDEGRPRDTHWTIPINFFASTYEPSSELSLFHGREFRNMKGKRPQVVFKEAVQSKKGTPRYSFKNEMPKHERPYMRFRGTSQIIDMVLMGEHVKVGISHTISEEQEGRTEKRVYLSHFYAFLPDPPFEIIAVSGHFCFNHMHENDAGHSAQWISERPIDNRTTPILVMGEYFRCPVITFASGMTEMIGDGNNAIITYGVNDCYSRSIVVPKKKIEMLLSGKIMGAYDIIK
jgi:hypothetical protein